LNNTFVKGLALLETLAIADRPRGVTELAEELGLAKSQVHRLLQTLSERGYVRQDPDSGRYAASLKMWEYGALVADRVDVRHVAGPHLQKLADRTSETVHMSVLDETEVLYIDKIDSPQPVRAYSRLGGRAPAYTVATGKALLAYVPGAVLAKLDGNLQRHTARTITQFDDLKRELTRVRDQGYAVNRGEWQESVCGLAVPIFGSNRRTVAAVGISGPLERLTPGVLRDFAPLVIDTGRAISRDLGFSGQPAIIE
jgi:IclR family KDG regulon transcriptional repressor